MGTAERRHHPDSVPLPRSGCPDSPRCQLPVAVGLRFGGFDGLWLHLGPIGASMTPLAFHRAERAALDTNRGRLSVATRPRHRRFEGCSLDLFAVEHPPGGDARRYVQSVDGSPQVLWVVFAVAWIEPAGPRVSWIAPGLGVRNEGYNALCGTLRPSPAVYQQIDRLVKLIDGGQRRRGRPALWENPAWRDIAARAIDRKDACPGLAWVSIADAEHMAVRTLMTWVGILRDERARVLRVMEGGAAE